EALPLGDDLGGLLGLFGIDVAQAGDLDVGDLDEAEQVVLAVPAAADEADARFLVGRGGEVVAGSEGQAGAAGGEESAAVHDDEAPGEGETNPDGVGGALGLATP